MTVGAAASQRALRYGVRDYLDGADPGNAVLVCEFGPTRPRTGLCNISRR
ncbi:MAG: hypothetical protein ACLT1W_13545 [Alistipes onderdonkii]